MSQVIDRLKHSITVNEFKLEKAKDDNFLHEVYSEAVQEATNLLTEVQEERKGIESLLKVSVKLSKKHRDQKIKFLEDEIDKNLGYLLPQEDFRVRLIFNDRNGEYYASLEITRGEAGKKAGDWHSPRAYNGRFIRQMISFSCMYAINKLRGSKVIWSDEALASADKVNLTMLKPLLDSLTDEGFQITIIEHKEELYQTLNRREFHLYKDRDKQEAIIRKVVDHEANSNT